MYTESIVHAAVIVAAIAAGGALLLIFCVVRAALLEYRRDRVPALLYHQLISRDKSEQTTLTDPYRAYIVYDSEFAEQMAYLHSEGYTTISIADLLAYQEGRTSLPAKPIIVTFDDGFASNYHYAFPILKKYGMTATIFVTPDRQSENFKKHSATDSPLTDAQMREMSEYGISIESHGMTHRYLTKLDPSATRWELTESKRTLEGILEKPVEYLAIPSGAYNRRVKRLAKEARYKAVFCMLKGSNNKKSDPYALRRVVIGRDVTIYDFRRILGRSTACYLRVSSALQNILHLVLGPRGLDTLRDLLYRSWVVSALKPGQVSYVVCGISGIMFLTVACVFIWFLWRYV